jgi:GH24 family phage-related lysozyme (muramidase)
MDATNAANAIADFTASKETFVASPYWDSNGYAIGYGNHYYQDGTAVGENDPDISESDAYNLMWYYLNQNAAAIIPQLTVQISDLQLGVLADVRYRCGTITTALLNLINSGADAPTVAAQIAVTCATVNGQADAGEAARAAAEAALYTDNNTSTNTPVILLGIGIAIVAGILIFGDNS